MRRGQNSSRCLFFKCHNSLLLLGTKWVGIHIKHLCQATLLTKLLSINVGFLRSFKLRKVFKRLSLFSIFSLGKRFRWFLPRGLPAECCTLYSKGRRLQWAVASLQSQWTGLIHQQELSQPGCVRCSQVSHLLIFSHLKSVSVPREEIPPPQEVYRKLPLQVFALLSSSLVPLSTHCSKATSTWPGREHCCSVLHSHWLGIIFFINKIFM